MRYKNEVRLGLYHALILLILRTTYIPDEYYQVIEPGYIQSTYNGLLEPCESSWEWLATYRLRSYIIALFQRILYFTAFNLGIHHPYVVKLLCRIMFAIASTTADIFLIQTARQFISGIDTDVICLVQMFSWYWSYTSCRALTNTLETCGLVLVQYLLSSYYQTQHIQRIHLVLLASLAVALVFIRPTSALFLVPMLTHSLVYEKKWTCEELLWTVRVGWIAAQSIILLDSAIDGVFTITPWNFLVVNVFQSRAAAFGIQPWHWNFTQGLPVVLGLYLPVVLIGLYHWKHWPSGLKRPVVVSIVYVLGLSLVTKHQEHRFLLPCLPGFHLLMAWVVQEWLVNKRGRKVSSRKLLLWTIFAVHAAMSFYLLVFHQAGTEMAFSTIAEDLYNRPSISSAQVIVAGPCFSFPGTAMISTPYRPVSLVKLPCHAPWEMDGVMKFDDDPHAATQILIEQSTKNVPITFLVTFDSYELLIKDTLRQNGFVLWKDISHAHFRYDYDDPYPKYRVLVYTKQANKTEKLV